MAEPDKDPKSPKSPSMLGRAKEEIKAVFHKPRHDKETHGTSDDIDDKTPVSEVKGPSVFKRVKEEVEAIVESFTPKGKDRDSSDSSK